MEKTIDQLRFVGLSGGEWPTYYDEESRRYHVDLCGAIGLSEPFWFGSDEEALDTFWRIIEEEEW